MKRDILIRKIEAQFLREVNHQPVLAGLLNRLSTELTEKYPTARIFASGGLLRDLAVRIAFGRDLPIKDLDLVVEGIAGSQLDDLLRELSRNWQNIEWVDRVGSSFPVWKLKAKGIPEPLDLALTRTERSFGFGHRDFQLSTRAVTVEEDSQRRDFTVNALYMEVKKNEKGFLETRLYDFHKGLPSIVKREIRCVGDPAERFKEDPLRMLRAIRLETKLNFYIEEATSRSIRQWLPRLLETFALERVSQELYLALVQNPDLAIAEFAKYGVFQEIIPDILMLPKSATERTAKQLKYLLEKRVSPPSPPLVFAALLQELALSEIQTKMRYSLKTATVDDRFFQIPKVLSLARRAKLPAVRTIDLLCTGVLLLVHYPLLKHRDAVIERLLNNTNDSESMLALYEATQDSFGREATDFRLHLKAFPYPCINFGHLVQDAGIPMGPHLNQIKLALRQAEIEAKIRDKGSAVELMDKLYTDDTHLIHEHLRKISMCFGMELSKKPAEKEISADLYPEIRWLLFTRPIRLLQAYRDHNVLQYIFPELVAADGVPGESRYHFSKKPFHDILLGLSLLFEKGENPSALQILSLIFLDVGKPKTMAIQPGGKVTYYNHQIAGAEIATSICVRLGISESLSSDVYFIIRNHNTLIQEGGSKRIRRLLHQGDSNLIDDLLLVHKIDQMAKMRIEAGQRIDEGQLANYNFVIANLSDWRTETARRHERKLAARKALLSGADLKAYNPSWGPGLPEGPKIGRIKNWLADIQEKGLIHSREEATEWVRGKVILCHLLDRPGTYLRGLHRHGLLDKILPELSVLIGLAQDCRYHMENAFDHTLGVVDALPKDGSRELIMAAIFHDTGKAMTRTWDEGKRIYHFYNHERQSAYVFGRLCERLKWTIDDFNTDAAIWLIRNHQKVQLKWSFLKRPERTLRRLFYRGSYDPAISEDTQADLVTLAVADIRGSVPADDMITEDKLSEMAYLADLMNKCFKAEKKHKINRAFDERVAQIWNGHAVLRNFAATGPEIGRLVKRGQVYVRDRLRIGERVTEDQVRNYLARHSSAEKS